MDVVVFWSTIRQVSRYIKEINSRQYSPLIYIDWAVVVDD